MEVSFGWGLGPAVYHWDDDCRFLEVNFHVAGGTPIKSDLNGLIMHLLIFTDN
jgi:hypothetical protein